MLFETDLDRLDFLKLLRFTIVAFDWHCRAYCLMGTHYHLVLETTREQLSNGMRKLNGDYARRFNKPHGWRATCSRSALHPLCSMTSSISTQLWSTSTRTRSARGSVTVQPTGLGAASRAKPARVPTR